MSKNYRLSFCFILFLFLFIGARCSVPDEKVSCPGDSGSNVDPSIDSIMEPVTTNSDDEIVFPVDSVEGTDKYDFQYTCDYQRVEDIPWEDTTAIPVRSHTSDNKVPGPGSTDLAKLCVYRARACKGSSCGCWYPEPLSVLGGLKSPENLALTSAGNSVSPTVTGNTSTFSINTFDFTITWTHPTPDIFELTIERYEYTEDNGRTFQELARSTSSLSASKDDDDYVTYSYQLRSCGKSDAIDDACGPWTRPMLVEIAKLPAPQDLKSDETPNANESTDGNFAITWQAPSGGGNITRYQIVEEIGGTAISNVTSTFLDRNLSPSTTSYSISNKAAHGEYTYKVRACASDQEGDCGAWADTTVTVLFAAPASFTSTETISTDGTYTLSWNVVTGADGSGGTSNADTYELQESTDGGTSWAPLQNTNSVTARITKNLATELGAPYEYRVRACRNPPGCGPWTAALTVTVAKSCSSPVETSGFHDGDGTEASPYLICSYTQLGLMRNGLSAHYELGQNITASGTWVPVGDGSSRFTGSLNGDGHTISNLTVNSGTHAGLFGYIDGANIRNLTLSNVSITASNDSGNSYAGALTAYNNNGTISDSCATSGSVFSSSATSSGWLSYAGGLVGYNSGGTISNSYATGSVAASASGPASSPRVGGLVGRNNDGTISNSYATGSVDATASSINSSAFAGGLVGG